jgi:hypothetical protein
MRKLTTEALEILQALGAHRNALIAFYDENTKAPRMFQNAVPDSLASTAAAEIAILRKDWRGAEQAMFRATTYMGGVGRYGALALSATTTRVDQLRGPLHRMIEAAEQSRGSKPTDNAEHQREAE